MPVYCPMRLLLLLLSSHLVFAQSPVSYVDPFIGTGGHGHTYPGASLPFGGVQLSPDTDDHGWDWCSGYNFRDSSIMGFSHTHLSGTGIADLADILVTPYVGAPRYERGAARSAFRHATEVASPGYYAVTLDDHDIRAELTAGPMTGYHRYTFPASAEAKITLDLTHGIDRDRTWLVERTLDAELRVVDSVTLAGYRMSTGWAHLQPVYFIAKFSKPPAGWGLVNGGVYRRGSELARGRAVQGVFDFRTAAGEAVELAVTISREPFPEGYRAPEPAFDRAANDAKANWANTLGTIEIEADPIIRTTFYTALYHASLAPNQLIDGRGDTLVSTFSQWDSYRAAFALNTLLRPGMVDDLLDNLLRAYDKNGYLPVWELWGEEVNCMIGTPSVPIVVEALNKGHDRRRSQLEEAIWATLHTDNPVAPWSRYDRFGYVPTGVGEIFSVSKTLEMAYANACAGSLGGRFTPLLAGPRLTTRYSTPRLGSSAAATPAASGRRSSTRPSPTRRPSWKPPRGSTSFTCSTTSPPCWISTAVRRVRPANSTSCFPPGRRASTSTSSTSRASSASTRTVTSPAITSPTSTTTSTNRGAPRKSSGLSVSASIPTRRMACAVMTTAVSSPPGTFFRRWVSTRSTRLRRPTTWASRSSSRPVL